MAKQDKKVKPKQEKKAKEKRMAYELYMHSEYSQKQIAEIVEVSEQALVDWVRDGKWKELKTSVNADDAELIASLEKQLQLLNEENLKALTDDDPATKPNTDGALKLAKSLHYLRKRFSPGQLYATGSEFLKYLQPINPDLAKKVAPHFTSFIKSKI